MSYAGQANQYRDMEVLSASPGQLVVLLYENLLVNLRRCRMAVETGNAEVRSQLLARSHAVLLELLVTLDREKGGSVAAELSALYTFMLGELLDQRFKPDAVKLDRVAKLVEELRDAFAEVAKSSTPAGSVPAFAQQAGV